MANFHKHKPGDPVWTLFSRRTLSRLAYWLSALGYDLRDRSAANRIYLVYFCAFWLAWIIAVIALLGGGTANLFVAIQNYSTPEHFVVVLGEYTFLVWALFEFWQVSRRSPFVFSQEDAYLLCQTPINRRKIALAWFLQGMMGVFILVAAATTLLSFALIESRVQGEITIFIVFEYLMAILRALIMILPILVGWQAGLWGLGAHRLHQRRETNWLQIIFFTMLLFFLVSFAYSPLRLVLLAPFSLSFQAAFIESVPRSDLLGGIGVNFLYLVAGLAFLFIQSGKINLSRAAQETSHITTTSQARSYGQFSLAATMLLRRRLGMARKPSRLLQHSGKTIQFWKDLLQSIRTLGFSDAFNLLLIFGLSLGMINSSNMASQVITAGVWTILIGGLANRRLRNDLAHWWLLRSLPLRPVRLLAGELSLSCGVYILAGWFALVISHPGPIFAVLLAVLLPLLIINAALATTHDILRHAQARILMSPSLAEENVPRQGIWGILQGLATVLIPFVVLVVASSTPGLALWGAAAIPVAFVMLLLNRHSSLSAYHRIE
jgi:hypothetical protein